MFTYMRTCRCDQIGRLNESFRTDFFTKVAKIFSIFRKKALAMFWATIEKLRYLYLIPTLAVPDDFELGK